MCLAKYVEDPVTSLKPKLNIGIVCGNCNLSFTTDKYCEIKSSTKRRYVANCIHCGKWNRVYLRTEKSKCLNISAVLTKEPRFSGVH